MLLLHYNLTDQQSKPHLTYCEYPHHVTCVYLVKCVIYTDIYRYTYIDLSNIQYNRKRYLACFKIAGYELKIRMDRTGKDQNIIILNRLKTTEHI